MRENRITENSKRLYNLNQKTIFKLKSGLSASRIEIYASGANRILKAPDTALMPKAEIKRTDTVSFSATARRRYMRYCNCLDLTGMNVYIMTVTIQADIERLLTRGAVDDLKKAFNKKLIRAGWDYVIKTEYTAKEVPHFHYFIYGKGTLYANDDERIEVARKIGAIFSRLVDYHIDSTYSLFDRASIDKHFADMCNNCVRLETPRNLKKAISYFATYTSKNKDYQNVLPRKYIGSRLWGYGRENYGDIRKEPVVIEINREIYNRLYAIALLRCPRLEKIPFVLNGIYLEGIEEILGKLDFSGFIFDNVSDFCIDDSHQVFDFPVGSIDHFKFATSEEIREFDNLLLSNF